MDTDLDIDMNIEYRHMRDILNIFRKSWVLDSDNLELTYKFKSKSKTYDKVACSSYACQFLPLPEIA